MTSSINYNNIDATFPVAGQDNSSQGFRDNFQNIKNNFEFAYNEITELQANSVQTGQTNNLAGSILSNALITSSRNVIYDHGDISGATTINFYNGNYQSANLTGSISISFTNFSTISGSVAVKLIFYVPNTGYTITWPASVSQAISTIDNQSGQVTTFSATGYYVFDLITSDSGSTWLVSESTRNRNTFHGNVNFKTDVSNVSTTGVSITVSNVGGTVVGTITANTIVVDSIVSNAASASYTGNLTAGNIIANTAIYGTLGNTAGLQPNITLVGNLTSLIVSGNVTAGNVTVSGLSDMCGGTAYGLQTETITNGGSTQIYSNVGAVLLRTGAGVGTISSHTVIMPASPYNGQTIQIAFANTVTTLTQAGSGSQTVNGAFTTANTTFGGTWLYVSSTDAWYRTG